MVQRATNVFDPKLVELPHPASLRALVPEHWPMIPELDRFFFDLIEDVVLIHEPSHADGSSLWPEDDLVVSLIGEGVHLLLHDVGRDAERAAESLRPLQRIEQQGLEPEPRLQHLHRRSLDDVVVVRILLKDLTHSLDTANFLNLLLHSSHKSDLMDKKWIKGNKIKLMV